MEIHVLIFVFYLTFERTICTPKRKVLDSYITHYGGEQSVLDNLLSRYNYKVEKEIVPTYFKIVSKKTIQTLNDTQRISLTALQRDDTHIESLYKEEYFSREKRKLRHEKRQLVDLNVTDKLWSKQWYLDPIQTNAMGVYSTWKKGFSGKGIVIAIVDDGIDTNHIDLVDNYNSSISTNIIRNTSNPEHMFPGEGHGTNCAGIAAAVDNDECVIGVAYDATLSAIRLLDEEAESTASMEASALVYKLDSIDIYSNSWGPTDDGAGYEASDTLSEIQEAALKHGITVGRDGKGAIYVWASGNGGKYDDDCNVDGYSSSMYTISINAVRYDGSIAWYSEECSSIMAVTYGGESSLNGIATTARGNQCIDDFEGTSAACPMAAGIIALALQANSFLSWRDVQHLIVEHSTKNNLPNANFYTNGAGKRVSLSHGFGMLNAEMLVVSALSWKSVPKRIKCSGPALNTTKSTRGTNTLEVHYRIDNCFIGFLEHVLVKLRFKVLWRQHTSIFLVSPSGTESRILRERKHDRDSSIVDWKFMSVHSWGENPVGVWKIKFISNERENVMVLYSWTLELYGTVTDPLQGSPLGGEIGGFCNSTTKCLNLKFCLEVDTVCIDCSNGFHEIGGSCIRDGIESGYCDASVICIDEENGCNATSGQCVHCSQGYHVIDSFCFKDGSLGGYCGVGIICEEAGIGCDRASFRCVNCTNGFHIIDTYCVKDGSLFGYCDAHVHCTDIGTGCNATSSKCVTCSLGYHVIDNFCVQDGELGGYCDNVVLCTNGDAGCDRNTSICINCTTGYHVINNYCVQDGHLGGHCDSLVHCVDSGVGCEAVSSLCTTCNTGSHIIDYYCVEDRTLGGLCNITYPCKIPGIGCNLSSNICVNCFPGFHAIGGICVQDGELGGYCSSDIHCAEAGSGCDKLNKVCVPCSFNKHVINGFCIYDGTLGGYCNESTPCTSAKLQCSDNTCITAENETYSNRANVIGIICGALAGAFVIAIVAAAILKRKWIRQTIWPKTTSDSMEPANRYVKQLDRVQRDLSISGINADVSTNIS